MTITLSDASGATRGVMVRPGLRLRRCERDFIADR
jgi:hypothetical protein